MSHKRCYPSSDEEDELDYHCDMTELNAEIESLLSLSTIPVMNAIRGMVAYSPDNDDQTAAAETVMVCQLPATSVDTDDGELSIPPVEPSTITAELSTTLIEPSTPPAKRSKVKKKREVQDDQN